MIGPRALLDYHLESHGTVYSEWLNTGVRLTWTYSEWMPVVPVLGTGLSPLMQWLVLPPLGMWVCRRRLAPSLDEDLA